LQRSATKRRLCCRPSSTHGTSPMTSMRALSSMRRTSELRPSPDFGARASADAACIPAPGRHLWHAASSMRVASPIRKTWPVTRRFGLRSVIYAVRLHRRTEPPSMTSMRAVSSMPRRVINGGRHLSGAPPCRQPAIASRPPPCDSPPRISSFAVKAHNRPGWVQGACWCCPTAGPASGSGDPGRNRFKSNSRQHGDP
jgi:hypothetical protein